MASPDDRRPEEAHLGIVGRQLSIFYHSMTSSIKSPSSELARQIRRNLWIYFVLIPPFALLFTFTLLPIIQSFILSFQHWTLKSVTWAGFENYERMMQDTLYFKALRNTFVYTLIVVPVGTAIALGLAELIRPLRPASQTFFKSAFYLPTVVAAAVIVLVWAWIYNPNEFGLLNYLLSLVGQKPVLWLQDPNIALMALTATSLVGGHGAAVVLILAAMGGIPDSLYESARLDGSTHGQEFQYITLPLLKPTILYLVVLGTINSFQVFTGIYLLTNGGPAFATATAVFYIFKTGFLSFEMSYASAQAAVLFAIIMVFSIILFRTLSTEVEF